MSATYGAVMALAPEAVLRISVFNCFFAYAFIG
jgi:hypothetical protein